MEPPKLDVHLVEIRLALAMISSPAMVGRVPAVVLSNNWALSLLSMSHRRRLKVD